MKTFTILLFSVVSVLLAFPVSAQTVVSETDITRQAEGTIPTDNWVGYTRGGGTLTFVPGPDTPPLGCGSLQFTTPLTADKAYLFNYDHIFTPLAAITGLAYSTYKTAGNADQVAAMNIEIDYNGLANSGGYAVLVFEPVYNLDQPAITNNSWQTWDAYNGGNAIWWSTQPLTTICGVTCYVTWNQILADNPNAIILGGFGVNQGTGNPALVSAVDALTITKGTTTTIYDFEAPSAGTLNTYYADNDGDGYGNANETITSCSGNPPTGYVDNNYDCDDTDGKPMVVACHNGVSKCFNANALQSHINHGDTPGPCSSSRTALGHMIPATPAISKALVYPSPSQGEINVQLPELSSKAEIIIISSTGAIVERRSAAGSKTESFDLHGKGAGVYFIKIITEEGVENLKVVIQ